MRQALVILIILLQLSVVRAQTSRDFKAEAARLVIMLDQNHFKLPQLDDKFSAEVLQNVINQLDPGHLYFDKAEIETLDKFRLQLDDELRGTGWTFLPTLTSVYKNALIRGNQSLSAVATEPIDWNAHEVFIPRGSSLPWSATDAERRRRWRLWLKYQVLTRAAEVADSANLAKGLTYLREKEREFAKHAVVVESRRTKRILENPGGFENLVASTYFRAVAAYYDPHSMYFSPQEFEKFRSAMSTKEFSFGLGLNEDQDGNVYIEYLIPGAPAWKSGDLHQGDVLMEVNWANETPFNLEGIGLEDLLEMLDRANPSSINLTVRQSNGLRKTVALKKAKIESEENTVKGFVLSGSKRIGYVSLPGFYTQWGDDESSSCATDMALEIIKLKTEGIDGLILDIRSNGGGSLKEAIEMSGIFIDEGPLVLMQNKSGQIVTLKDVNRGTVYDGPLIVLINGQSASASEILAAAIQDYNRGIILGGSSFGKATGQVVFSLDPRNAEPSSSKPTQGDDFGYATITLDRLYRVTGRSNQGKGVLPDIRLPDLYGGSFFHESSYAHAFPNDTVPKKAFFKPLQPLPIAELKRRSDTRTTADPIFKNMAKLETALSGMETKADGAITLSWSEFLTGDKATDLDIEGSPTTLYDVSFPEFNRQRIEMNSYLKEYTLQWLDNLKKDPYVEEAFRISCDYIGLKSVNRRP